MRLSLISLSKNTIINIGLIVSFLLVSFILWNTNTLFQILKNEERAKMELWASAQKELIKKENLNNDYGNIVFDVLQKIGNTPIILLNSKEKIIDYKNIEWEIEFNKDSSDLYHQLKILKIQNDPIIINYDNLINQKLYYGDSKILRKLQYYPIALLLVILLFGSVLYFYFRITKISEQNKLWAGMAKETAHQIGTPLTSLMGWTSLIKERGLKNNSILEIEKDIKRLEIITERFSKIGSLPDLKESNLVDLILDTINYLKKRNSKYLKWEYIHNEKKIKIPVNEILFSWTLENILNNSIDSMKGKGKIKIVLKNEKRLIRLLIIDSGKGIPRKNFKLIFNPGFTTKKKGWGLGLSLSKRIIEDYHKGILRIKKSIIGKGTNFEIIIKK